jgi:hypothetical protein
MVRITKKDEKKEEKKRQTVCLFAYYNSEMFHSQAMV